jgi:hypothetical protein
MKNTIYTSLVLTFCFLTLVGTVAAQRETETGYQVEKDLDLLRRDLRSEKKKIIAINVPLTDTESTKFWPVYDDYALAMKGHYDQFYSLIKEYAANQKTLTDAQAIDMVKKWSTIQVELAQTRQKYVPMFEKVISGRKAALFLQIDRRLYELIDLQIASEVPLVAPSN